jgi:hypothetical protein
VSDRPDRSLSDLIRAFARDRMVVDSGVVYERVGEKFRSDQARSVLRAQGTQLVCQTESLKNRLLYQLRLMTERSPVRMREFKNRLLLEEYYRSVYDFDSQPRTFLVYTKEPLTRLLDRPQVGLLTDRLVAGQSSTYYLRHPVMTRGRIALVQNVATWQEAVQLAYVWQQNRSLEVTDRTPLVRQFKLYVWQPTEEVRIYQVGDGPVPVDPIQILGMRIDDATLYAPLRLLS